MSRNRMKPVILLAVVIVIGAVAGMLFFLRSNETVAIVNDEPLMAQELQLEMEKYKAEIETRFITQYNADISESGFWEKNFNGEIPSEVLRQKALDSAVRIKLQQALGKELGILSDISYRGMQRQLAEINRQRKEDVKNNKVVYGPVELDESYFRDKIFSETVEKIKEKLKDTNFAVSDEQIQKSYLDDRETKYKKLDELIIKSVEIPVSSKEASKPLTEKEALELASRVGAEIKNGLEPEKAAARVASDYSAYGIRIAEYKLDEKTRFRAGRLAAIKQEAYKLDQGQTSGIIQNNSIFHILQCIGRRIGGYKELSEVREEVRKAIVDVKYEKLIDDLVKKARIQVHDNKLRNGIF